MRAASFSACLACAWFAFALPASACGVDTDCAVEAEGSGARLYRIDRRDGQTGAFLFAHGYRGSAAGTMRNRALRDAAAREGFALVAVEAKEGWMTPHAPRPQRWSEMPYFDAVVADLVAKHGIDPERIVMGGFSSGAMVVWNVACERPSLFAGFLPVAGTYWKEPPATCALPTPTIVHVHGLTDRTVPMDGRALGGTRQGRVSDAFDQMARVGGYGPARPDESQSRMDCTVRGNEAGKVLELCLHPGGHVMPAEYATFGLERLKHWNAVR